MKKTAKVLLFLFLVIIISFLMASCDEELFSMEPSYLWEGNFGFKKNGDELELRIYTGGYKKEAIVIPSKIDNYKVTSIGEQAFKGDYFTKVVIPDTVKTIKREAFYHCFNLMCVWLGNSVTDIEEDAFYECERLVEIFNRSTLDVKAGSFDFGRIALYAKEVYTQPHSTKIVPDENGYVLYTDENEVSLINYIGNEHKLTLPEGITEINRCALIWKNLESITIPESVKKIERNAFSYNTFLISITFCGTKAKWNSIKKERNWCPEDADYTIHCTDGDIKE